MLKVVVLVVSWNVVNPHFRSLKCDLSGKVKWNSFSLPNIMRSGSETTNIDIQPIDLTIHN